LTRDNKKEKSSAPTDNQIYALPANRFSPSEGTTLPSHAPKINLKIKSGNMYFFIFAETGIARVATHNP